ncbi:unnamed protein product [Symbiodinium pilosum]|uniref:Uncharacterized protein n=1 Tax=Symbiodinium pilosum TaxID=2952 RepID=A0A812W285_SYMPI|nr:unnamed protein product [Symbiodinium pilosum]
MSVPQLLPLPCCCLLNTDGTWSEFLILEKLKDHHWLCVDINWSYREIGCFESAVLQTSHGLQVCRFGKLDDPERFTDTDLQSDACLVFFLRTTADGHPLPSIREGEWLETSQYEGDIDDLQHPRGEGRGILHPTHLEAVGAQTA